MKINTSLACLLNKSVVYIKGLNPNKIGSAEKRKIAEHLKLWSILLCFIDRDGCNNEVFSYIKSNKLLSSSLPLDNLPGGVTECADNDKVLSLIRLLIGKISVMFYSPKPDHIKMFAYIRALHHLPKCFLSLENKSHISEDEAISYMKDELVNYDNETI